MTDGVIGGIIGGIVSVLLLVIWAQIDWWLLMRKNKQGRRFRFK